MPCAGSRTANSERYVYAADEGRYSSASAFEPAARTHDLFRDSVPGTYHFVYVQKAIISHRREFLLFLDGFCPRSNFLTATLGLVQAGLSYLDCTTHADNNTARNASRTVPLA
jgi:hypothetical protein